MNHLARISRVSRLLYGKTLSRICLKREFRFNAFIMLIFVIYGGQNYYRIRVSVFKIRAY